MKLLSVVFLIATMVVDLAAADNILVAHSLGMGSHISIPQALSRQVCTATRTNLAASN